MTKQEINNYLNKHYFLIFRYKSKYYSLQKSKSLFRPMYSLITTDKSSQRRNSLDELYKQVYICENTLLIEAIKYIEILNWDDPSWETYEAVRHVAIVYKNEIHFMYNQRSYWIAHTSEGLSYLSDDFGNTQSFNSCFDLFENARIDDHALKDIWRNVIVDAC